MAQFICALFYLLISSYCCYHNLICCKIKAKSLYLNRIKAVDNIQTVDYIVKK